MSSGGFEYLCPINSPSHPSLTIFSNMMKDNIKSFHGNGEEITLFGESAGAGSVSTHLISPMSRHIPRQIKDILQSIE